MRLLLSEGVDPNAAVEATGWHALLAAVEGGGKQLERRGDMHAAVRSPYLYNQLQGVETAPLNLSCIWQTR